MWIWSPMILQTLRHRNLVAVTVTGLAVSDPTLSVELIPEFILEFADFSQQVTFDGTDSQKVTIQGIDFSVNGIAGQMGVLTGVVIGAELFYNCADMLVDNAQNAATGTVLVDFSLSYEMCPSKETTTDHLVTRRINQCVGELILRVTNTNFNVGEAIDCTKSTDLFAAYATWLTTVSGATVDDENVEQWLQTDSANRTIDIFNPENSKFICSFFFDGQSVSVKNTACADLSLKAVPRCTDQVINLQMIASVVVNAGGIVGSSAGCCITHRYGSIRSNFFSDIDSRVYQ